MSYWGTVLGTDTPPAHRREPVPQTVAPSGPWWSSPTPQPRQSAPTEQALVQDGQWQTHPTAVQAPSLTKHDRCPACGSDKYGSFGGANYMPHCYECGHNPRFEQTSGGGGLPGGTGAPTPAYQTVEGGRGGLSNYNPANIVAHVN